MQSLTKNLTERPAFRRNSGYVDVYVTGPFWNENTRYSHWSVVYGNLNDAWMMKASFMGGYVRTILNLCNFKPEDSLHTFEAKNVVNYQLGSALRLKRK